MSFLLMPFIQRSTRDIIFAHRPNQIEGLKPQYLANSFNGNIYNYDNWLSIVDEYDYFLVCGSNLIDRAFALTGKILNVHSGLIPIVRGLDSFKWAILNDAPLGNTLHQISPEIDAGLIICHWQTKVFLKDSIQTLAKRHYQNEIWMLVHFDKLFTGPVSSYSIKAATKRMSIKNELIMLDYFDTYKSINAVE
ncbi:formyltransferase family protein [Ochrobactrum chromiisoli]|uniref:Formyltransferase family protein n=1 Tax=Ochrobactrum chromiisoli TaxID=2993941 RepID=A0ABT3QP53_9HYPH|nr:formyltransferase family protein [Ochrobactrum chromiisoli]MCX2697399.1 formyltransferase family protein [Ochrobactrum chromiisoli]